MAQRSNQAWVRELTGQAGHQNQRQAHQDLASYLYVVAYNYLRLRQGDLAALEDLAPEDLAALAQDMVQETLERLARDGFALLMSYREDGKFTSWAAQVVRNQAAQELRKSYWVRRGRLPDGDAGDEEGDGRELVAELEDASAADPSQQAQQQQVRDLLHACLTRLSDRYRLVVLNCLGAGVSADRVAHALDTTANAVYLIVQRAKRQLRQCLERSGLDHTALAVFD